MGDSRGSQRRGLHAPARHHRGEHRAAEHPRGPRRKLHRPPVGCGRLHAHARRVRSGRGISGRPPWPPSCVRVGAWDLHSRLRVRGGIARPNLAQPVPRGAGHRRCDHVRGLARPDRAGVQGQGARDGDRPVRRDDRHSRGHRAARGRRADRRHRLAIGVRAERADRDRGDRVDVPQDRRVARPRGSGCGLGRSRDVQRLAVPSGARAPARECRGVGECVDRRPARRRGGPVRRVHRGRAAAEEPDAAVPPVPDPSVHGRPDRVVRDLRVDVRAVPLPDAVHAEHPRPVSARDRAALSAADGCLVLRRTACGRADVEAAGTRDAGRRAPDGGFRPDPDGRDRTGRRVDRPARRIPDRGRGHRPDQSGDRERGRERRAARAERHGLGHQRHVPAGRDRRGDRGLRRALLEHRRIRDRGARPGCGWTRAGRSGLVGEPPREHARATWRTPLARASSPASTRSR